MRLWLECYQVRMSYYWPNYFTSRGGAGRIGFCFKESYWVNFYCGITSTIFGDFPILHWKKGGFFVAQLFWPSSFLELKYEQMKFPIINISEAHWSSPELLEYVLFDEFIYTDNASVFEKYLQSKAFCDCNGEIYYVKSKALPFERWRKFFRFFPNVYRVKLNFEQTAKRISLEDLKAYLLERVGELEEDEFRNRWMLQLKAATSYEELINGEVK